MTWKGLPGALPQPESDLVIGASAKGEHFFVGDLDEIRISNAARTIGWIRAAYKAEGPDGLLISYGEEEMGGGGGLPVFYLRTIVKNISLEGWVIIGLLVFFSAFSWLIFFTKVFTLMLVRKDNTSFLDSFSKIKRIYELAGNDRFDFSSLYRVYAAGCEELKERLGNPGKIPEGARIGDRDMNALKAALDRAYVRENQRLNAWLVVLTMAITGGPFLGLLGTVWGVMNTFAAMAEAGEANIMAIAPGVASALSTTVFGLIVAIPALFMYNYLSSKIRAMAMELAAFVDQFPFKVEETAGSEE
jgi:biopolymer transport protein ExbB